MALRADGRLARGERLRRRSSRHERLTKFGLDLRRIVLAFSGESQQRNVRNLEDAFNKSISHLAIMAFMTLVIKFDAREWSHGARVAQQVIHMLSVDAVSMRLVIGGSPRNKKHIVEIHFRADDGSIANNIRQHTEKRSLGRRDKIITHSVGELACISGGAISTQKQSNSWPRHPSLLCAIDRLEIGRVGAWRWGWLMPHLDTRRSPRMVALQQLA
jgi:hypothetical protein